METSHVLGWSRLAQVGGTMCLIVAALVEVRWLAVLGAVVLAGALIGTGLAKARHYRSLPISAGQRFALVGSWLAVVVGVMAVVWQFLVRRMDVAGPEFSLLPLGIGALGVAMVHYGLQQSWLSHLSTGANTEDGPT